MTKSPRTGNQALGSATVRTPDQRLRVFISSTLGELRPEREAARASIERLRLTPVMFELGARPHPPRTLYRAYLEQSHVFVGIYWQRYGWVPPEEQISGLEDELRLSGGRPRLVYIKEPSPEREQPLASMIGELESEGELSYRRFETIEELGELLAEDLAHLLSERFESAEEARENVIGRPTGGLPVPLTRLVGREEAAESLWSLLDSDEVRLVTLTGVGGIGKSRLALEVAGRARRQDPDRVVFVDLAPVEDPDLFGRSVAAALGIRQRPNEPLIETITDDLGSRSILLVLDNFEQIAEAAPDLERILTACPRVEALVTSRVALALAGEHRFRVPPLTTEETSAHASHSPAVELFVERAQEVDPGFTLTPANRPDVAELCRRLDGLPLAIELAAARLHLLTPAALTAHLDECLDMPGSARRPERQRTLRATIDWSHELLDPGAQRLFARLAVFSGGWTLPAAQEVCGRDLESDVIETMGSLLDKSLVTVDERRRGEPRFRMLETVRDYAGERLRASGEQDDVRRRHAEHFAAFCDEAAPHLFGAGQQEWLARVDADIDNVRALAPWALAGGDPELSARAIAVLWLFYWVRGLAVELRETMESLLPHLESAPAGLRANVALARGGPYFLTGDLAAARECLGEAVANAREAGEVPVLVVALTTLATSTPIDHGYDEARRLLEEATRTSTAAGWQWGLAFAQVQLGALLLRDRRLTEAERVYVRCLQIAEELDDDSIRALSILPLGVVHLLGEDFDRARQTLTAGALICRRNSNHENFAYCLEAFAAMFRGQSNPEPGARLLGAAQTIRELIAVPVWPFYRPLIETLYASLREDLGEAFDDIYAAGRRMSEDEALNFALNTSEGSNGQSAASSA